MKLDYVSFRKEFKGSDHDFWNDPEKVDALTEECIDCLVRDKEDLDDVSCCVAHVKVSPFGDTIFVGGWSQEKIKVALDQSTLFHGSIVPDQKYFEECVDYVVEYFNDVKETSVFKKGTKSLMFIIIVDINGGNFNLYYGYTQ